jgi:TonB family protein
MSFRRAAQQLTVRGRLAHRRIRRVLSRTTARQALGPLTMWSAAVSLAAHVFITWSAVSISSTQHPDAESDSLVATRFLYPLMQRRPAPLQEHVRFFGLGKGVAAPVSRPTPASTGDIRPAVEEVAVAPEPEAAPAPPVEAYSELEVDLAAERDPDSVGPVYPEGMLQKQIEGSARVRFIIDSTGHAREESFAVIEANERAFADAVRLALPLMKFRPASIGTKTVSQKVEQTFVFKITPKPVTP